MCEWSNGQSCVTGLMGSHWSNGQQSCVTGVIDSHVRVV